MSFYIPRDIYFKSQDMIYVLDILSPNRKVSSSKRETALGYFSQTYNIPAENLEEQLRYSFFEQKSNPTFANNNGLFEEESLEFPQEDKNAVISALRNIISQKYRPTFKEKK